MPKKYTIRCHDCSGQGSIEVVAPCGNCNGNDYCSSCNGHRYIKTTISCSKCGGSGQVECVA